MVFQNSGRKYIESDANDFDNGDGTDNRLTRIKLNDDLDALFGYERHEERTERIAWLINMHPADMLDDEKRLISAADYYFLQEDGSRFKVSLPFKPYFYIAAKPGSEREVSTFLSKRFQNLIHSIETVHKEDLDLPNHLSGLKQTYLKLQFLSTNDLQKAKKELMPKIRKNKMRMKSRSDYAELLSSHLAGEAGSSRTRNQQDQMDNIVDIREYDVPYHVRVSIDLKIFVGRWYSVVGRGTNAPEIILCTNKVEPPDPIVLAFDIETTKLPLKFPDAQLDQVMMISYMIDGQGYLIVNREIVGGDVEDFEYTPKPEYEGPFIVFNEVDEQNLLQKFFNHVREVKPHIFVTYNGDFFDWPFVETRAQMYGLDMAREIGFEKDNQGEYKARHAVHMDAYRWVKRDSYLPVGSQNLKACAKAKLRYDPVELDPEEMCRMASEQPQVLANYSVSDAVATYYLYMKYVHPFVFALCTIIPMEPDEVLRKGSGTLCETLLMVEAFHANIIFPNKQEAVLNKLTEDGHVMDQETYVGGHVEAIESGVFRADIPCRFRMVPSAYQELVDGVERTLRHAIEVEEGVPLEYVTNFTEVCDSVRATLEDLRDVPSRLEKPVIYHLDVGAMYPNIILTNRLQPPAIVNEAVCAACDFNKPGAKCQRTMPWMWRGEIMPATRSEYQRVVQQLETEKFPSFFPGGPQRNFHQLNKEEQATIEKKRLQDYCRKAYRKLHETRLELRNTTVCQQENSFYVDTVRAFRDRRYEYKGMLKGAKKALAEAQTKGDAAEIKSAKTKEILFDSLQLAHKCILNSFYGYVMRKGSRWFSMEMAGIVCYTGANIIRQARELIEQIGRPLELDTDGIWCMLPSSFPETYTIETTYSKKQKLSLSYPGAMLNLMVKDAYTNDQYHELVDPITHKYEIRSENSIFFEVDGPYLAMILPASKEEGKKLKKRYAVFNLDSSLAELKGFEIKRRGELQLIKIFQSSVFDAFLKGSSLTEVYASVSTVADYWLDVLYSKAEDMPDSELFELISENRNMSRKLEDYGAQKSTSISTAKRLAEFLGDQMVKDAGLSCRYIIARKPEGSPVTERAIPLAIFQAEPSIRRHYLKKWLRLPSLMDLDIREILDWDYYIERLGSTIQKIITIPAALQGISNPVPRVAHPDWLRKRMLEKTDVLKQKRITEVFSKKTTAEWIEENSNVNDIENIGESSTRATSTNVTKSKTKGKNSRKRGRAEAITEDQMKPWHQVLGNAPKMDGTKESQLEWVEFQKKKWNLMSRQKREKRRQLALGRTRDALVSTTAGQSRTPTSFGGKAPLRSVGAFMRRTALALYECPWQILQIRETQQPGDFRMWVLVNGELHDLKLKVPRIFYVNLKKPNKTGEKPGGVCDRVHKTLPRSNPRYYLYRYCVPEHLYIQHVNEMNAELSVPEVEGMYETQVPLMFRVLSDIGCLAQVAPDKRKLFRGRDTDTFSLDQLEFLTIAHVNYLENDSVKYLFLYHYSQDNRAILALFNPAERKVHVVIVDRGRSQEGMPRWDNLYMNERTAKIDKGANVEELPKDSHEFVVTVESQYRLACRAIQRQIQEYLSRKLGPTILALQSADGIDQLTTDMPSLVNLPCVYLNLTDPQNLFSSLDWKRVGAKRMIQHYLNVQIILMSYVELSRYLHVPLGNVPQDLAIFGSDLFYARHLQRQNHILWCSPTDRPDLGGKEIDDNRLMTNLEDNWSFDIDVPGCYHSVCLELDLVGLPVTTLLQSHQIHDMEGASGAVGFDAVPQLSIDELVGGSSGYKMLASYDETALSAAAFRVLKTMVCNWVKDIHTHQNVYADHLVIHFYRWLRSASALLFDPALKKTLNGLMRKLFMLLISELRRLGAVIIHADFSRIVICSKKRTVDDAIAYIEFILKSIQQRDLFSTLDITVKHAWKMLIWLDPANYAGVRGSLDPKEASGQDGSNVRRGGENLECVTPEPIIDTDDDIEVDMNWNLMQYLPETETLDIQDNFKVLTASYIYEVFKFMRTEADKISQTPIGKNYESDEVLSQTVKATATIDNLANICPELVEFAQKFVVDQLSPKLLAFVTRINRRVVMDPIAREHGMTALFPKLPGSHLHLDNPAMELIKAVCKVLSLDSIIYSQVMKMRRDALRLIGVGEFAEAAEWKDPCVSYRLAEVICKYCNHCRDLDLCRDPFVQLNDQGELGSWRCMQCKREYDRDLIEGQLIQATNQFCVAYTLQDLTCKRCKGVKQAHMPQRCDCAGEYEQTFKIGELQNKLRTFRNIASMYQMELLEQTLQVIFIGNGWQ